MSEIRYGINLYSKYTGDLTILGSTFPTREDAKEYVDKEVCLRCNRVEIVMIPSDWRWVNRHLGFRPPGAILPPSA